MLLLYVTIAKHSLWVISFQSKSVDKSWLWIKYMTYIAAHIILPIIVGLNTERNTKDESWYYLYCENIVDVASKLHDCMLPDIISTCPLTVAVNYSCTNSI